MGTRTRDNRNHDPDKAYACVALAPASQDCGAGGTLLEIEFTRAEEANDHPWRRRDAGRVQPAFRLAAANLQMANLPLAQMMRTRMMRVGGGIVISTVLLWLALRRVSYDDAVRSLESTHVGWMAFALGLYWAELAVRIGRWRLMLGSIGHIPVRAVGKALIIGYAANNVLPARLGELLRADLIGRTGAIARLAALGTIVLERLLDMIAVTSCALIGFALIARGGEFGTAIRQAVTISIVVIVGIALAIAALWFVRRRDLTRFPRAAAWIDALDAGLAPMRRPRVLTPVLMLTILLWCLNGGAVWAIVRAVGPDVGTRDVLVLLGIGGIAAAIPSAPASLGTLQFAFVLGFSLLQLPVASGFLAAGLIQLVLLGSVTVAGSILYAMTFARGASAPAAISPR